MTNIETKINWVSKTITNRILNRFIIKPSNKAYIYLAASSSISETNITKCKSGDTINFSAFNCL